MPLTLVSCAACSPRGLSTWRPEDYNAYKFVRAVAGRPIGGSAWMPLPDGQIRRLTNASADAAVRRFLDCAVASIEGLSCDHHGLALVPVPGPRRVVGAPPSRSRVLAQELSIRTGCRVLDILRWRQPMPSCRPPDPQTFSDNIITTGSPVRAECVLVADFLSSTAPLRAVAAKLRQFGSVAVLAVSAGRTAHPLPSDPFAVVTEPIDDFVPAGF